MLMVRSGSGGRPSGLRACFSSGTREEAGSGVPSPPFPGEGLVIACGKGFRMRFGKKGIGAVASITAAAALLTCLVPVALADNGGGGSGEGGGGDHGGPSQTADVHWIYKDSCRPRWMA